MSPPPDVDNVFRAALIVAGVALLMVFLIGVAVGAAAGVVGGK